MIQSGTHPDADMLTAFVEHSLPADERELILTHMSVCTRCREVAFLAQHAAEPEPPIVAAPSSIPIPKTLGRWPGGWRWIWIPTGVFALMVGIATGLHFGHTITQTQVPRNSAESNSLQQTTPQYGSTAEGTIERGVSRRVPLQSQNGALNQQPEMAIGPVAPPISIKPKLARGVHGTGNTHAQGTSPGEQLASQPQQSEMQLNLIQQNGQPQQNLLQSRRSRNEALGDKRAIFGLAPASASDTVAVEVGMAKAKPAPPASGPPAQLSYNADATMLTENGAAPGSRDAFLESMHRGVPASSQIVFNVRTVASDLNVPNGPVAGQISAMKNRVERYAIDYAASLGTIGLTENANGVRLGKVAALAIAYDREGNLLNWVGNTVPINLSQAAWDQSSRDGLQIHQVLDLPAGDVFLRVGLYDLSSGRFGSVEIPLHVAAAK